MSKNLLKQIGRKKIKIQAQEALAMRAKKCDRCGKLFEHYDGSKEFKQTERANAILLIDRDLDNKYWSRKSYDLCPECMKMIEELLNEKDIL